MSIDYKQLREVTKILRTGSKGKLFAANPSRYTPLELTENIFNSINRNISSCSIAVLFTIEIAIELHAQGAKNVTVITSDNCPETKKLTDYLGYKYVLLGDITMKFDIVLSNPPYSSGDYLLYPAFFEKCLEIADTVVMVMPVDLESQQKKLKNHNIRVKTHCIYKSENITSHFNVGIPDIRYVIASKSITNDIPEYKDPLKTHPRLYPLRKRLSVRRGYKEFGYKKNHATIGIDAIVTIHRGSKVAWATIKPEIAKRKKPNMITDAPYLVLVGEHPSKGLFNTTIIENNGTKWGGGCFAIDAESLDEAKIIDKWMTSLEMQKEVQSLLTLKNTYSMSEPMMRVLPWYE